MSAASDRVNPIVVKEVRQGLRTRLFVVSFLLLLAICTVAALLSLDHAAGANGTYGRELFKVDFFCFAVVGFFVLPVNAYRSLAREREEETWSALALTTLNPRQIARGKILSFLVQGGLYASAIAPFLLFSYFLGGIALVTILVVMALALVAQAFVTTLAVCWATLPDGRLTRGASFFLVLAVLGGCAMMAVGAASDIVSSPNDLLQRDSLVAAGCLFVYALSLAALLFELAVARLSPPSSNTARWPRLLVALHVLLPIAFVYGGIAHTDRPELGLTALYYDTLLLFVFGLAVLGESDAPPRLLRRVSLLVPGVRRGLLFLVLLDAAVALALSPTLDAAHPVGWHPYAMAPAFLALYLALAALVGRGLLGQVITAANSRRALAILFLFFGAVLPPLAAMASGRDADDPVLNAFNPFVALSDGLGPTAYWNLREARSEPFVVVPVALAILLVTERILRARERQADALGVVQGGSRAV